jgi:multiple sugar transport system substrate-binding protein
MVKVRKKGIVAAVFSIIFLFASLQAAMADDYGKFPGVTLKVALLSGDHPVAWKELLPEFEQATGVTVEIVDIPFGDIYAKTYLEAVTHSGAYDIMETAGMWVPDFVVNGLLHPLDGYFKKWDWGFEDVVSAYREMGTFQGHRYSVIADGDVFALYYRKDIFQNESIRAAFEKSNRKELTVPDTWEEYIKIAEFINKERSSGSDDLKDVWGCDAMFNRSNGPFTFIQLFRSYGGKFFNPDTMEPNLLSEAGKKAMETIVAMAKNSSPGAANHDFTSTRDDFTAGRTAMLVQWPDIGSWSGISKDSAVTGNVGYALVPAGEIGGKPNRKSELAWNWQWMISADSENPEAAAQLLRFMTSKKNSKKVISMARGYDPYRISHFSDLKWAEDWFPGAIDFLNNLSKNLEYGSYDLLMPGAFQYYDVIGKVMGDVITGEKDVDSGLKEINKEWVKITRKWGKDRQKAFYRSYLEQYK